MQAIILAGGKGTRLKPFTNNFPKPLVPIDDLPILEIVLRQLKSHGITKITLAVNHLASLIEAFFGDGKRLGLDISYSFEDQPLGTAGPISLITELDDDFLIMNGDLLSTINYRKLIDFHHTNKCDITISTFKREEKIDLGVIESSGDSFVNYVEKPTYYFDVSMGIYVVNKSIIDLIPKNVRFDIPDLVMKAKKHEKTIKCFSDECYWLDIGRADDYEIANNIFREKRNLFLPK